MKKILFLIFITIITFISCSKKETITNVQPKLSGTIQGQVTSAYNGKVVSGVTIQTIPATSSVSTDSLGNYTILEVPAGEYAVTAHRTSFTDTTITINVGSGKQAVVNFQMSGAIPEAPVLIYPEDNAAGVTLPLTISWHAVTGAVIYKLQVSQSNSFSSFVFSQGEITDTSIEVQGLTNSVLYYWRVSATTISGTSDFSVVRSFTGFLCGSSAVSYEGKMYHTVQIGSQCWFMENLDVGTQITGIPDQKNNQIIEKYCFNDDPSNCLSYGGLYQWGEAVQYKNGADNNTLGNPALTGNVQGICPQGWHIPKDAEIAVLSSSVSGNGNALKEIGQGSGDGAGTNTSGFSGLFGGMRGSLEAFWNIKQHGYFLTSEEPMPGLTTYIDLSTSSNAIFSSTFDKYYALSVRCLKD